MTRPENVDILVDAGHDVLVLDLAEIVRLERSSSHPKDRAMLPVLEETLRRRDP